MDKLYPTDAVSLTKKLINIDSTNPGNYEKEIVKYICSWLDFHNIKYKKSNVEDGRENIMAYVGNIEKKKLVYICHMDTVVVGNDWTMDAFSALEKDNKIFGRGACDMKSGLACAMSAMFNINKQYKEGDMPFALICTVDEEENMHGVEKVIEDKWVSNIDLILDTEPTDAQIQVSHKGRFWVKTKFKGITAHASTPWKGVDAIAASAEFISCLRKEINVLPAHEELGKTTIAFGKINGGYRPYVVSDYVEIYMDIRSVPPLDKKMLDSILNKCIEKSATEIPNIVIEYEYTGKRPFIIKDDSSELLSVLKKTTKEVCKEEAIVSTFTGYTDTAVISSTLSNNNCMSYGPGSLLVAHKPDEYVPIDDILRCEKVLLSLYKNINKNKA